MKDAIPKQIEGSFSDTVSEVNFETVAEAKVHFESVKNRFLDINSWELFAGEQKASFSLRDNEGNLLLETPQEENYLRIEIPGLKNACGEGFDWVIIEKIEEESTPAIESVFIRVRPISDPTKQENKTAHFFCDKATCTFIIKRIGSNIFAEVHGRNEEPNMQHLNLSEKARNFLVAMGGILGGSKFQWKSLTEGLIKKK